MTRKIAIITGTAAVFTLVGVLSVSAQQVAGEQDYVERDALIELSPAEKAAVANAPEMAAAELEALRQARADSTVMLPSGEDAQAAPVLRVPVEDDIITATISSDSPYYLPRMMARYMAGDLTLTADHYYYLYYGYAYDSAYDAHRPLPGENTMLGIFERTNTPSREDAAAIIEAGKENMLVDPFSPSNINMMTYAYDILGDTINAAISADRFRKVIGAIQSSGTGLRENSPWHILRFSHAVDMAAARSFKVVNRQVRTVDVEYLQFDRNPERVRGWFFDFSRVYWNPFEGERVRRKSRWEFNGMPL